MSGLPQSFYEGLSTVKADREGLSHIVPASLMKVVVDDIRRITFSLYERPGP